VTDDKLIVVVDDSPSVRETIAFILEAEGFRVRSAANGKEGLALATELKPKVVLTDAMMPGLDGFELCRHLKEGSAESKICVIMLTSMGQTIDRERADEVGVDYFVTKPFDEDEIMALLDAAFAD
jgi:DNA-binding response OmpR family regulator